MLICGVDEVGRGALAGPMYVVAAVFDDNKPKPEGVTIRDSKKMTEIGREMAFYGILPAAVSIGLGYSYPEELNRLRMARGWQACCLRAIEHLSVRPDLILVDGDTKIDLPFKCEQQVVVRGDDKYWQISAASIIAKVMRDNLMKELHEYAPWYGWDRNKGYGSSKKHKLAVQKYGPHPTLHRTSWKWKGVW